jgi:hypothetical protein
MNRLPKTVYANIIWFIVIFIGTIFSIIDRHLSKEWKTMPDNRVQYDILFGIIDLALVFSVMGLLSRKKWGYFVALTTNATIACSTITVFAVHLILFSNAMALDKSFSIFSETIVIGFISLFFFMLLAKKRIKAIYN